MGWASWVSDTDLIFSEPQEIIALCICWGQKRQLGTAGRPLPPSLLTSTEGDHALLWDKPGLAEPARWQSADGACSPEGSFWGNFSDAF